jgi:hypothetical protein
MNLSPFAQYCIRRLLRHNLEDFNDLLSEEERSHLGTEVNLDKILNHVYLDKTEVAAKIDEIEVLTKLYQDLEQANADPKNLTEIQRRILYLLGFRTTTEEVTKLPTVLPETSVNIFRFYFTGKVREGVYFNSEIYGLTHQFPAIHRLYVYQLAWALAEQGVPLRLTVSPTRYGIWVNLRSPTYTALLQQDITLYKVFLHLYTVLRQCKSAVVRRSRQRVAPHSS